MLGCRTVRPCSAHAAYGRNHEHEHHAREGREHQGQVHGSPYDSRAIAPTFRTVVRVLLIAGSA